jgi:alpha-1,2-mannosyltransferase
MSDVSGSADAGKAAATAVTAVTAQPAASVSLDPHTAEPGIAIEPDGAVAPRPASRHGWHLHRWHGPGMVRRALHGSRRAPLATLAAAVIVAATVGPLLLPRLYAQIDYRMVDLAVYRSAGDSLLHGRPLYDYLTPVPQLLPFTYPPFSAVIAIPLAAMSRQAANWVWTLGTLAVLGWLVLVAFRPFIRRFPSSYRPVVAAALLASMAWTMPVRDCFRFGQVAIFLAALCMLDCVVPKTRWPRGMMIGLATAIKLVPGVFIPYLWLTGRRRAAVVATAWFAGVTLATTIAMPQASKAYWTSALFDSNRLGNNAGTSNQALRGMFLRVLPGAAGSALWVLAVGVVVVVAYRWAMGASALGAEVRAVAIVGMLSVLVSPVSWIHHLAGWIPVAIGVLLGDGRNLRRVGYAVLGTVFFALEMPWWGDTLANRYPHYAVFGRLLQNSYTIGALIVVTLLARSAAGGGGRSSATRPGVLVSR